MSLRFRNEYIFINDLHLVNIKVCNYSVMASLTTILLVALIRENTVYGMPIGDLINLARSNSTIRVALHQFPLQQEEQEKSPAISEDQSNTSANHDTQYWRKLKAGSALVCAEPCHTRGDHIRGCRTCSMPVCEACIIRDSFNERNGGIFSNRTRSLCPECYNEGNIRTEGLGTTRNRARICPTIRESLRAVCVCTVCRPSSNALYILRNA